MITAADITNEQIRELLLAVERERKDASGATYDELLDCDRNTFVGHLRRIRESRAFEQRKP